MTQHHKKMLWIDWIVIVLLLIGGFAWGLIGWFNFSLLNWIFPNSMISTIIYALVGLAAITGIIRLFMKK
jgi:uncharacterized protein